MQLIDDAAFTMLKLNLPSSAGDQIESRQLNSGSNFEEAVKTYESRDQDEIIDQSSDGVDDTPYSPGPKLAK